VDSGETDGLGKYFCSACSSAVAAQTSKSAVSGFQTAALLKDVAQADLEVGNTVLPWREKPALRDRGNALVSRSAAVPGRSNVIKQQTLCKLRVRPRMGALRLSSHRSSHPFAYGQMSGIYKR